MKRVLAILVTIIALTVSNMASAQLAWRETNREIQGRSLTDPRATDGVELYGNNGVISIKTTRRINVRVFTILGQSVSQATLNPGSYELKVGTRGIFIVKIGNLTQKVAL
ncbi:MAG: hypothetical protein J6S96_04385 [Muribaculaceae bacterium]|nr:hypothetical protein [Muribaculaceae bacterium]